MNLPTKLITPGKNSFWKKVFNHVPMENHSKALGPKKVYSVDFEVFGRVQGVFFRKHTQKQAKELGLNGWCMNTERGTVQGLLEGEKEKIEDMKKWLQHTGSPLSQIERADFRNEKLVLSPNYKDFKIRR